VNKGVEMVSRMGKFFASDKAFIPFFVFCLFVPLFFHGPRFGLPYIKGGDEPHYLVMINSLLNDGDLDLTNNYESAREGSRQAGKKFAGQALEPQGVWNIGGRQVIWSQVYEDTNRWEKNGAGAYVPKKKPDTHFDVSGLPMYSSHPAGIAFILFPILWCFRGTGAVEPLALVCSEVAVLFAVFGFRRILQRSITDSFSINLATFLAFLGTPLWAYGRSLFMEPFLLSFAVWAYALALERKSGFWIGLLLGLGALLKPNFLILLFPLTGLWIFERKIRDLLLALVGPVLATGLILYLNARWYGSPWTPPQPFHFGNPLSGMIGLWFSWNHGILALSPVVFLALIGWKKFIHEKQREAILVGFGFLIYFLMMASFECWWGGWCYGPRLIAPVFSFLMIPLVYLPDFYSSLKSPILKFSIWFVCFISLLFNFAGAMDGYWDSHPIVMFSGKFF
jgi:hypothetical protein